MLAVFVCELDSSACAVSICFFGHATSQSGKQRGSTNFQRNCDFSTSVKTWFAEVGGSTRMELTIAPSIYPSIYSSHLKSIPLKTSRLSNYECFIVKAALHLREFGVVVLRVRAPLGGGYEHRQTSSLVAFEPLFCLSRTRRRSTQRRISAG